MSTETDIKRQQRQEKKATSIMVRFDLLPSTTVSYMNFYYSRKKPEKKVNMSTETDVEKTTHVRNNYFDYGSV